MRGTTTTDLSNRALDKKKQFHCDYVKIALDIVIINHATDRLYLKVIMKEIISDIIIYYCNLMLIQKKRIHLRIVSNIY